MSQWSRVACLPQLFGQLGGCGMRVLQSGIIAWFTSQIRWVMCWPCMHFGCVPLLCCETIFLMYSHGILHGCSDVAMRKLMLLLWSSFQCMYDQLHVVICCLHVPFLYYWLHIAIYCDKYFQFTLDYMCLCMCGPCLSFGVVRMCSSVLSTFMVLHYPCTLVRLMSSCMRSWYVLLTQSCLDDWTLTKFMVIRLYSYDLYLYMFL